MLVVGYVFAIRSERLICREVQVNLAYRWFCKLGIEDAIPDHSAFSRARNERFREGEVFRRVFERVVETCIAAGLVGGEGFAVDASLIQADANKQRSIAGQDWRRDRDPARSSRAVEENRRWRWPGDQGCETSQVLGYCSKNELIMGASRATQSKPAESQDALQMREPHLDLLALPP